MNQENQCCPLEQSKKIKELGVHAKSLFAWSPFRFLEKYELLYTNLGEVPENWLSAYTVAELIRMLDFYSFSKRGDGFFSCGFIFDREKAFTGLLNTNAAEGLANLLIEELESSRLTPEECIKRLNH